MLFVSADLLADLLDTSGTEWGEVLLVVALKEVNVLGSNSSSISSSSSNMSMGL